MSRAEHEALVEETAGAIHAARFDVAVRCSLAEADAIDRAYSMRLARAVLALIAQELETVTEEMLAAMHTSRALPPSLAVEYWRAMLAVSPLFPGKDP